MHQQDGQVKAIGNLFQYRQRGVVPGVTVAVRFQLADFLQGVDDDEPGFRVVTQKIGELFFQSAAQKLRVGGDGQVSGFAAGDLHQTALEPLVGVLQAQVEHTALPGFQLPHRQPQTDAVGQPQHQPGLTDFGSTRQKIQPLAQQTFDELRVVRELHVHQLISGDGVEAAYLDPQHPANLLEGIGCFSEAVAFHSVVHHVSFAAAVGAAPEKIPNHLRVLPAMRADGEGGFVVGNLGGFQIINEAELDFRSQDFRRLH